MRWTRETIERLWDHSTSGDRSRSDYFSFSSGESVLAFARRWVPLREKRVLDFGCGPGYLLEHLLREGALCAGVEFSAASVEAVRRKLGAHPRFRGITRASGLPTPLPDASEDAVFLVEVIEHLLDDQLVATVDELHRLVVAGGQVVVTTPNREDLAQSTVMCPECGAVFHRWQHVRSFSAGSLEALMSSRGFRTVRCTAALFGNRDPLQEFAHRLRLVMGRAFLPHLVYIGRKA